MMKYVEDCIEEFEQEAMVLKKVTTPVTGNLFRVRNGGDRTILQHNRATLFHSMVAKLLFLAKRGRPDILLAVSFLTARVKTPDEDDWNKLVRVLSYLKATVDISLTLTCTSMSSLNWYFDGSYATHDDMKGQNGAVLLIGDTTVISRSNKQKVNTRSSTEAELIAIDDALPTVQWAKSLMMDQGYDFNTIIKEDNKSTMLLMKNRRLLSGKRTKHLDIRYFYVRDLLERGILTVKHCSSYDMIADFFTKPIQGRKFQTFRDIILNRSTASALQYRSVLDNNRNDTIVQADETERFNTGKWESQISEEERLKRKNEREILVKGQ
jgi:hypothetical protein